MLLRQIEQYDRMPRERTAAKVCAYLDHTRRSV